MDAQTRSDAPTTIRPALRCLFAFGTIQQPANCCSQWCQRQSQRRASANPLRFRRNGSPAGNNTTLAASSAKPRRTSPRSDNQGKFLSSACKHRNSAPKCGPRMQSLACFGERTAIRLIRGAEANASNDERNIQHTWAKPSARRPFQAHVPSGGSGLLVFRATQTKWNRCSTTTASTVGSGERRLPPAGVRPMSA